jgi:hypothetical protein
MKKIFIMITLSVLLISCSDLLDKKFESQTSPLKLRQLGNTNERESTSNGSVALFFAAYHSEEKNVDYIKVFAEVEGAYRFLEIPMERVRVKLDSSSQVPYLLIHYNYFSQKEMKFSDNNICDNKSYVFDITDYTIVCREEYLPEKLLPINITGK